MRVATRTNNQLTQGSAIVTADDLVADLLNDTWDEAGINREKYFRWLFNVWTDLNFDFFRLKRTVSLTVPANGIVDLPADYVDFIKLKYRDDCGNEFPISVNGNLANPMIEYDHNCTVCGQLDLCQYLAYDEQQETVYVNGDPYTKTTTRVIRPDGSYTEEVREPVMYPGDTGGYTVIMETSSRVVCQLDKSCNHCVPASPKNRSMLQDCGCSDSLICCPTDLMPYPVIPDGSHYRLFEQEGFLVMAPNSCLKRVELEYVTSGVCRQGQWYFPLVAANTLIEGTYYRSIAKKRNISPNEKDYQRKVYYAEVKKLLRRMTRLSYMEFLECIFTIPRLPSI